MKISLKYKNRFNKNQPHYPTAAQEFLLKAAVFSGSMAEDAFGKWREAVDIDEIDHILFTVGSGDDGP